MVDDLRRISDNNAAGELLEPFRISGLEICVRELFYVTNFASEYITLIVMNFYHTFLHIVHFSLLAFKIVFPVIKFTPKFVLDIFKSYSISFR